MLQAGDGLRLILKAADKFGVVGKPAMDNLYRDFTAHCRLNSSMDGAVSPRTDFFLDFITAYPMGLWCVKTKGRVSCLIPHQVTGNRLRKQPALPRAGRKGPTLS